MFALTPSLSYYLCPGYVDMRKGIYSLYQTVKSELKRDPLSGEVFIFLGKTGRQIKILHWERDGFLLYHKKLEKGRYQKPLYHIAEGRCHLDWQAFVWMMQGAGCRSGKVS